MEAMLPSIQFSLLLDGYARLFEDSSIWTGYRNTIIYTVVGTLLSIIVTVSAGFALSRKNLAGRNVLMAYFIITMYFGGGMIPLYVVINTLGLNNNPAVMVILGMVSVYNMIICRTFFQSNLPDELFEAAEIDGSRSFSVLFPHRHTALKSNYCCHGRILRRRAMELLFQCYDVSFQ